MKKICYYFIGFVFVLIFTSFTAMSEDGSENNKLCVSMGKIPIKLPEKIKPNRTIVQFSHGVHSNFNCKECHHTWSKNNPIDSCSTSKCHDGIESPEKPLKYLKYTKESIKYFKYAFHKACIGCHKEIKLQNSEAEENKSEPVKIKKTGPTGCVECHTADSD
ncbi:MAG: cytochrome c3 family protein [Desulfobacterales bacterium]|nr:cytochrome c3 family protein [Desulfobacterales bacterium]MBF0398366.1 cytochrome c3 family protein [Desulfobacterales bacterium]